MKGVTMMNRRRLVYGSYMWGMDIFGEFPHVICNIEGKPVERDKANWPYSYDRFVIWKGDWSETDYAVYSDRLCQWDSKKYSECCKQVWPNSGGLFSQKSPLDIERFLSLYFGKQIKLTGIEEGCNVSNGYPYWIFYYMDI